MENYNLTSDKYAELFSDFYADNEATYGENLEQAYADFEEALAAEMEAEQFEAYYSETQGVYGEDLEQAYADFKGFQEEEYDEEDEDSDEEYDEEEEYDEDEDEDFEEEEEDEEEEYDEDEDEEDDLEEDEDSDDEDEEYEEEEDEDEDDEEEYSDEDAAFEEFYSATLDIYGDNVEEAYADFQEIIEEDEFSNKGRMATMGAVGGALNGAATGAIYGQIGTSFGNTAKRRRELKKLRDAGRITDKERKELSELVKKRSALKGKMALGGAAIGGVAGGMNGHALGKHMDKYSAEDFDNDFMDFYSEAEALYEGNVEEAFSDFEELMESEYSISGVASKIGGALSKAGKSVKKGLSKGFDKTQKFIHTHIAEPGATRHALHHGSYADEVEVEEDNNSLKEVGKKVAASWKRGNDKFDKWIDGSHKKLTKVGLTTPNGKAQYSDEDFLQMDEFSEGFATYYSDNEELYGDTEADLEEAYDDYADLVAEEELELMFSDEFDDEVSDSEYAFADKFKGLGDKAKGLAGKAKGLATGTVGKGAGIGAGAGLAAGLIAGSVGKDAKERRALKAKGAGRSAEETAKYNALKKSRRNKIVGGTLAGAAVGAGAGVAKDKGLFGKKQAALAEKNNSAEDVAEEAKDTNNSAEDTTEVQTAVESGAKERSFSAVDLLGKSGGFNLGSTRTVSKEKEDRTFSGSDAAKSDVKISTSILGILGKK